LIADLGMHTRPITRNRGLDSPGEDDAWRKRLSPLSERDACVLIPVFALGKTQEILAMLYKFRANGCCPEFPIYIGGLARNSQTSMIAGAHTTRRNWPRLKLMREVAPFILNDETLRYSGAQRTRVRLSADMIPKTLSNVCPAKSSRTRSTRSSCRLRNPESPAGLLREAGQGGKVALESHKSPQRIRCNIEQFQFSAHATRESAHRLCKKISPKKIVLVHGDPPAVEWMRATLSNDFRLGGNCAHAGLRRSSLAAPPP